MNTGLLILAKVCEESFVKITLSKNESRIRNTTKVKSVKLKRRKETKKRTKFSPAQWNYLGNIFLNVTQNPDATLKKDISSIINISAKTVEIWFQNRRAEKRRGKTLKFYI